MGVTKDLALYLALLLRTAFAQLAGYQYARTTIRAISHPGAKRQLAQGNIPRHNHRSSHIVVIKVVGAEYYFSAAHFQPGDLLLSTVRRGISYHSGVVLVPC